MNIDWGQILVTAVPIILGIGFIWLRLQKVLAALVAFGEVITVINASLADKALSAEEVVAIKKELSEAIQALKDIVAK